MRLGGSMRVLIVDDAPHVARTFGSLVERCGFECLQATDGAQALEVAASQRPDLVFVDLGLPDMEGYELARRLRDDVGLVEAKIFALSGYDENAKESILAGLDGHLVKPVPFSTVRRILECSKPIVLGRDRSLRVDVVHQEKQAQ